MVKSKTPNPLDPLWQAYHQDRSVEHRNRLVEAYLPLLFGVVGRLARRLRADRDELEGYAYEGLIGAVERYDPARGLSPPAYLYHRVGQAVFEGYRDHQRLRRTQYARVRAFREAAEALTEEQGRPPTEHEHAKRLGLTLADYAERRRWVAAATEQALEAIAHENGTPVAFRDECRAPPGAETSVRDLLRRLMRGFSREERLILMLYRLEGLSMREVGAVMGVSESRVSQRLQDIMERLREKAGEWQCRHRSSNSSPAGPGSPGKPSNGSGES